MSDPLYDIVFYGIVQPGKDREQALHNMAKLFKTEPARLKSYFSGERKVIKSRVDSQVAEKYRAALENIGLVIKLEEVAPPAGESGGEAAPTQPAGAENAAVSDTGGLSVAEVGADVLENPPPVEARPIGDISALSMAEAGADVFEHPPEKPAPPQLDLDALSLAEAGADVFAHPPEKPAPPQLDLDALSLAEVGADVFEHPPEKPAPPQLDTSELELDGDAH